MLMLLLTGFKVSMLLIKSVCRWVNVEKNEVLSKASGALESVAHLVDLIRVETLLNLGIVLRQCMLHTGTQDERGGGGKGWGSGGCCAVKALEKALAAGNV